MNFIEYAKLKRENRLPKELTREIKIDFSEFNEFSRILSKYGRISISYNGSVPYTIPVCDEFNYKHGIKEYILLGPDKQRMTHYAISSFNKHFDTYSEFAKLNIPINTFEKLVIEKYQEIKLFYA